MVRLTRVEQQRRTRIAVLRAATEEFTEYGYGGAKVDRIADRADLTRGAVYSNFPGKRALYFAVLTDLVEATEPATVRAAPADPGEALGRFARVWLGRLPLSGDTPEHGKLQLRSLTDALNEPTRATLAQAHELQALLLGLALESVRPPRSRRRRRVRQAGVALTLLSGAVQLAESAPGFGDPFAVVQACERLAGLDKDDVWDSPHLAYADPAQPADAPWSPPDGLSDVITGDPASLSEDGVITVLGTGRLAAAENAIRAAGRDYQITIAVVSKDQAERGRLARLMISDVIRALRQVFPPDCWPNVRLILDEDHRLAAAAGVPDVDDETEAAVRVAGSKIIARATGRGSGHVAALASIGSL